MREVRDKIGIQIEITNACRFSCTNCYKFVGHHVRPYFMELETVKKAIDSLEGYPGGIGITGGEPTLHPDFAEICRYLRNKVPPDQRLLQTTGYKMDVYRTVIQKTFIASRVRCNNHRDETEKHHPMLVAIKDVVPDDSLRSELIDKCWVREKWSALINVKGCFSCEIAGTFDVLYNGPGGHPIEKGWWAKGYEHFDEPLERYCWRCGAALPQPPVTMENNKDNVSVSNFRILQKIRSPKFQKNRVLLVEKEYTVKDVEKIAETWKPWRHQGDQSFGKNTLQRYGIMFRIFFRNHLKLRYIFNKFRKVEDRLWRFVWHFSRKIG